MSAGTVTAEIKVALAQTRKTSVLQNNLIAVPTPDLTQTSVELAPNATQVLASIATFVSIFTVSGPVRATFTKPDSTQFTIDIAKALVLTAVFNQISLLNTNAAAIQLQIVYG